MKPDAEAGADERRHRPRVDRAGLGASGENLGSRRAEVGGGGARPGVGELAVPRAVAPNGACVVRLVSLPT